MSKKKPAITLVELMIVAVIVFIGILSVWQVYIRAMNMVVQAKELNIATDDAKDVLEKIRAVPFANMLTAFPPGAAVNPTTRLGAPFALRDEVIRVTYPSGAGTDLVQVRVTVTWTGKDRRTYTRVFDTKRSRGL